MHFVGFGFGFGSGSVLGCLISNCSRPKFDDQQDRPALEVVKQGRDDRTQHEHLEEQ